MLTRRGLGDAAYGVLLASPAGGQVRAGVGDGPQPSVECHGMSRPTKSSRSQVWLESLGDWAWPGQGAASEAVLGPPSWVAAFPPRLESAVAPAGHAGAARSSVRLTPRALLLIALLSALAAVSGALALKGPLALDRGEGAQVASRAAHTRSLAAVPASRRLPALIPVSHDSNGSAIDRVGFHSKALDERASFLVYLPPGYTPADRYPVIYLLHGQAGHATAFLEVGLQPTLDRLIGRGAIPPMLAVMIQDRNTLNNWQWNSASYVIEVQKLVDRMLPTRATRAARAIAGSSKGGFGAMHIALANPYRFSVVESWLGYFNHLGGELEKDRPVLSRLGLHAFVYGASEDQAANPAEDPAFAAELREAGAQAESVIYPGNHSLATVAEHLEEGLLFAGQELRSEQLRGAVNTWSPRANHLFSP